MARLRGRKTRVNAAIDESLYKELSELNYSTSSAIVQGLELFIKSKKESSVDDMQDKLNIITNQINNTNKLVMELLKSTYHKTYIKNLENNNALIELEPQNLTCVKEEYDLKLNELINNYNKSCSKIITDFKKQQLNLFTNRIKDLNDIKRINNITPEESFSLSISILKKLTSDDVVIAVFSFGKGEWADNVYWKDYIDTQRNAVDAGAIVERIFNATKKSSDSSVKTIPIEMMHDLKTNKFIGYLMRDEDEAKAFDSVPSDLKTPDLIDIFKSGFMLINSKSTGERMAVIDHFDENFNYRTDIIFDTNILTNIETMFNIIKKNVRQISIN